jgi:hypothetical protein
MARSKKSDRHDSYLRSVDSGEAWDVALTPPCVEREDGAEVFSIRLESGELLALVAVYAGQDRRWIVWGTVGAENRYFETHDTAAGHAIALIAHANGYRHALDDLNAKARVRRARKAGLEESRFPGRPKDLKVQEETLQARLAESLGRTRKDIARTSRIKDATLRQRLRRQRLRESEEGSDGAV